MRSEFIPFPQFHPPIRPCQWERAVAVHHSRIPNRPDKIVGTFAQVIRWSTNLLKATDGYNRNVAMDYRLHAIYALLVVVYCPTWIMLSTVRPTGVLPGTGLIPAR